MTTRLHIIYIAVIAVLATSLCGCIKNDIPYPHDQLNFLEFEAEGQSSSADIDTKNCIITVNLPEPVNLRRVGVASYLLSEGAELVSPDFNEPLDLRENVKVTLHRYYDTEWIIRANQPIARCFVLPNQVGTSVIDVPGKRVVAYVPKTADLTALQVDTIKLGPAEVTSVSRNLNHQVVDFSLPLRLTVSYHDEVEIWTIYVQTTDVNVATSRVDAWSRVIWAYGEGKAGENNGIQYREKDTEEWITVDAASVTHSGGSFTARINSVKPETTYEVRAYSGEELGEVVTVTTQGIFTVPNMDFDDWSLNGKIYQPWAEGDVSFWDTGNRGATTLGDSNTVPGNITWDGSSGRCAMLQTKFVGIGVVGKLATGNIYTGEFVRIDGSNGVLNFGRPFAGRPTRLNGYMKYTTAPISSTNSDLAYMKGRPDTANIYIALTDWEAPYEIRTNPKNQQLFDLKDEHIIAYGALQWGANVDEFTQFTIPLEYRATNRIPRYILIVAAASKYGDFFTGADGACLWVDHFWLDWDY